MTSEKLPIYFASSSENKFQEYRFLMGSYANVKWFELTIEEIKTLDFDILVRRKIEQVKHYLPHMPFMVEQTGLRIHAWDQLPGTLTGHFMETVSPAGICRMMADFPDRQATAVTSLGYHTANGNVQVFPGITHGQIARKPRGATGFGWDSIFIPNNQHNNESKTFAQMSFEDKIQLSTRVEVTAGFYTAVLKQNQATDLPGLRVRLRTLISRHFNLTELDQLCYSLNIDHEELPSRNKTEKVQELILYCDRHSKIKELLTTLQSARPRVEWPTFS